nr:UbiA family prenyltransferase [Stackebrandtia albiflava]
MTLLPLLKASHFGPTVTVTAVAVALSATDRPLPDTVLVAAAVLAGQLSIGWSNDWIDAARDVASGRADKPVASGLLSRRLVATAAIVAAVACLPLSLLATPTGGAHVVAVAAGWAYNLVLKRTVWSVAPYAVAFALLVVFAMDGPPWPLVVAGGLLGAAAHFGNALPDLAEDAATGVHGLPHRLGATGSRFAALGCLAAASVPLFLLLGTPWVFAALAAVAVAAGWAWWGGSRRPVFLLVQSTALIDVAMLLLVANLR